MSVTIEWVEASYGQAITGFVRPSEFTDDGSIFFDDDGTVPAGSYGVPIDSGGHLTLIVGTIAELVAFAERFSAAVTYAAADAMPGGKG